MNVIPVLLAGGSGTRLWPLSRKSYPKQFAKLDGDLSLFQQSALRMSSSGVLGFAPPITLTNSDFRFIIVDQLQAVGIDPGAILIEPEGKNTAPAVLAACLYALRDDPEAVLLVSPVDHFISDTIAFHNAINQGLAVLSEGKIVIFGIPPTRPETGYGYLQFSKVALGSPMPLTRFVEKPDLVESLKMLEDGSYLWNAGIVLCRARDMLEAFREHASYLVEPVKLAIDAGQVDLGFWRLAPEAWSKCKSISIDYAVMEKVGNLMVVPFAKGWSDLGDWRSIWIEQFHSGDGVVTQGNVAAMECKDSLLWSESSQQVLVGLGLEDIVAVAMPDAVLVAHKEKTQDIKLVVEELKKKAAPQAESFPLDYRPWGWFESLIIENGFQVKRIHVKPNASLSLQSHKYRSEHWIVVSGVATVTVGNDTRDIKEGQSVFVPVGAIHRMENKGSRPMVLIEVQTGTYLGEDDIIRYEDKYSRT
jgi:mannose-1-phosphate guanylyltransferase/mannose-6-phosphate isomerase